MTTTATFEKQTKALIDDLKSVCANYGLGNDGNEFKIITQVFLYKFLNDKFVHEIKQLEPKLAKADNWELDRIAKMDMLLLKMSIAELQIFPSIPTKVTLNEYIEISKFYSTPKSNLFINGVLDKAINKLTEEKKIKKSGRGLI